VTRSALQLQPVLFVSKQVVGIDEVTRLAAGAGFDGEALITMVAIAGAESGFDENNIGDLDLSELGEESVGLWQINYRPSRDAFLKNGIVTPRPGAGARWPPACIIPEANAKSAYEISGGGTKFTPWSTFTNGKYKQFLAAARESVNRKVGVPGGPGTVPITAPAPSAAVLADTVVFDVPPPVGPELVIVAGQVIGPNDLSEHLVSGSVVLSTDGVSEATVVLEDQTFALAAKYSISVGSPARFDNARWEVVELKLSAQGTIPVLTLRMHPLGALRFRSSSPTPGMNVSPTNYLAAGAKANGMAFVGEPSGSRPAVSPTMIKDTLGGVPVNRMQTWWEVAKQLAGELGFLAFESKGTFYFGTPFYLAAKGARVQLAYQDGRAANGGAVLDCLQVPECTASRRVYHRAGGTTQIAGTTVTYLNGVDTLENIQVRADVQRENAPNVHPGMCVAVAGVGPFNKTSMLLTRVTYQLDATTPLSVSATTTEAPTASARTTADDQATAFTPSAGAAPAPSSGQGPRLGMNQRTNLFGPHGDEVRLRSFKTPWGMTVRLHQLIATRFAVACNDAYASSKWTPALIGSYNNRHNVNNPSEWSLHSWGLAFDFYSTSAYQGDIQGPTYAPDPAFRAAFKRHGFYLGAEFHGHKDFPHSEWASAPPPRGS
jgi:hypothetical protein